jgi:hypothetical protein
MTLIVRLIDKYALWIYVLCGLGMLYYLRAALAARNEGEQAMFSLERETAAKRVYRSSGMILVLLLIVVGVYGLSNYVDLPLLNTTTGETPTPETDVDMTATVAPTRTGSRPGSDETSPDQPTANQPQSDKEPTPTRRLRVTPAAPPTPAQDTPTPQVIPPNCPHPNVQLSQPGQNQVISAGIEVQGRAVKEGFDRYEFKFTSRDVPGDEWHWVETFRDPVENGSLGFWPTAHLPAGKYRFMLIVIDKSGNSQECIVPVAIQH